MLLSVALIPQPPEYEICVMDKFLKFYRVWTSIVLTWRRDQNFDECCKTGCDPGN